MRKNVRQIHISYLRQRVKSAPVITCGEWQINNSVKHIVSMYVDGIRVERHVEGSKAGKKLLGIKNMIDEDKRILTLLEKNWYMEYKAICDSIYVPDYGQTADKQFFDSLVERCNTYKPPKGQKTPPPTVHNGRIYKSKLEADFARLMDEYGIPFKYEPRISTIGKKTRCPDFFIYLPWLDLLIMVEIYGACEKDDYISTIRDRQYEYLSCKWLPGTNMLSLYYKDDTSYIPEMVIEEIETIECRRFLSLQNEGFFKMSA